MVNCTLNRIASFLVFMMTHLCLQAQTENVVISGKIIGYEKKVPVLKNLEIWVQDPIKDDIITFDTEVKSDGTFVISFPIFQQQDILIRYGSDLTLIAKPSDSIQLKFKSDSILETVTFEGGNSIINRELALYHLAQNRYWGKNYSESGIKFAKLNGKKKRPDRSVQTICLQ